MPPQQALTAAPGLQGSIGLVSVVNILSPVGPSPAALLARRLRLAPARTEVTTIGGNSPQWLVNRAAAAIAAGELDGALVVGAEAQRSAKLRRASPGAPGLPLPPTSAATRTATRADRRPPTPWWATTGPGCRAPRWRPGSSPPSTSTRCSRASWRAARGRSLADQRRALGALMAPFTAVAAGHRDAWFPQVRTPDELATVTPDNRLVAEPYPKRLCAFLQVDQGAAVLVTSLAAARAAGVGGAGRVLLVGGRDDRRVVPLRPPRPRFVPRPAGRGGRRHRRGGPRRGRHRRIRRLLVLPVRGRDGARGPRGVRDRRPGPHRHRRPSVFRRPRQQLLAPRHRHDGRSPARAGRDRTGQRTGLVRHQARGGRLRRLPSPPGLAPGGHRRRPTSHRCVGPARGVIDRRPRRRRGVDRRGEPRGRRLGRPRDRRASRRAPGRAPPRPKTSSTRWRGATSSGTTSRCRAPRPATTWPAESGPSRRAPGGGVGAGAARLGPTVGERPSEEEHPCPQSNAIAEEESRSSPSTGPRHATPSTGT